MSGGCYHDDMYGTCDCEQKDWNYSMMSQFSLLILLCSVVPPILLATHVWKTKPQVTSMFRNCLLVIFGRFLMGPVVSARSFQDSSLLLQPVPGYLFCIGSFCVFLAQESISWGALLRGPLHATSVLGPDRFERYRYWSAGLSWLAAIASAVVHIGMIYRLNNFSLTSEEKRDLIKGFYASLFGVLVISRVVGIVFTGVERLFVLSKLPPDMPIKFHDRRKTAESSQIFNFALLLVLIALALYYTWFGIDGWYKCGGLYYLYIFVPCHIVMTTAPMLGMYVQLQGILREAKETAELFDAAEQAKLIQVIDAGVRTLSQQVLKGPPADPPLPVWKRGVSWVFLESVLASCNVSKEHSTEQVLEEVIKPATKSAKCSAWEAVHAGRQETSSTPPLVGESTIFVSHARSSNFLSLVETLRNHCSKRKLPLRTTFFFIDIFCQNPHVAPGEGQHNGNGSHVLEDIMKAIQFPGKMVVTMDPWHRPETLIRLWCYYELYLAAVTATSVHAELNKDDEQAVKDALAKDINVANDMLAEVDVETAQATDEQDRLMILAAIEADIGLERFSDIVKSKLRVLFNEATVGLVLVKQESKVRRNIRVHGRRASTELPLLAV